EHDGSAAASRASRNSATSADCSPDLRSLATVGDQLTDPLAHGIASALHIARRRVHDDVGRDANAFEFGALREILALRAHADSHAVTKRCADRLAARAG